MEELSGDRWRAARLAAQGIAPQAGGGPLEIARRLVVVQSQDRLAAALGLRARGGGFTAADVERLRVEERALVRTWLHRGTIQLLATEDLGWLLRLLGPRAAASTLGRWKALGLDEVTWDCARPLLSRMLADGPLTGRRIAERFVSEGIDPSGQRLPHLLLRAALEGLVCDGPDDGDERTWVLLQDWLGPAAVQGGPDGGDAAVELARRYLRGHGPAAVEDFAWWAGLPIGMARAAFAGLGDEIQEVRAGGATLAALAGAIPDGEATRVVRLLPAFDAYLVAYKRRAHAGEPDVLGKVLTGGMFKPFVCRGGLAVGTWWPRRAGGRVDVRVDLFAGEDPASLDAELADLTRYLTALIVHSGR